MFRRKTPADDKAGQPHILKMSRNQAAYSFVQLAAWANILPEGIRAQYDAAFLTRMQSVMQQSSLTQMIQAYDDSGYATRLACLLTSGIVTARDLPETAPLFRENAAELFVDPAQSVLAIEPDADIVVDISRSGRTGKGPLARINGLLWRFIMVKPAMTEAFRKEQMPDFTAIVRAADQPLQELKV